MSSMCDKVIYLFGVTVSTGKNNAKDVVGTTMSTVSRH